MGTGLKVKAFLSTELLLLTFQDTPTHFLCVFAFCNNMSAMNDPYFALLCTVAIYCPVTKDHFVPSQQGQAMCMLPTSSI